MGGEEISTLEKPDPENLKDILEYHQLYELQVDIKLSNHKDTIIQKTGEILEEIINTNKTKKNTEPILPEKLKTL